VTAEEKVQAIQEIVDQPWTAEYKVLKIRLVLAPQPDMRPIETDDHGWPMLNAEGTAWERHDDPEANR
jgi:hypothetical protein